MKISKNILLSLVMAAVLSGQASAADEEKKEESLPNWKEDNLTGDWGGMRANLYKKGIELEFTHRSDILANTSGGIKRGSAWIGLTNARLTLDLEKLWGWSDTTAFVGYQSILGSKFNTNYVGSFSGVDNNEVITNSAMFYQAWLQKNWLEDRVSVLAGLYQLDSEFNITDTSMVFVQPPLGTNNEIAQPQPGSNGPPIFPFAALGTRLKLTSSNGDFYLLAAVTEGEPGDPTDQRGNHLKLGNGEGVLSMFEFGYKPQLAEEDADAEVFNKTALGFWRYSREFDSIDGQSRKHNQGAYFLSERTLYTEKGQPAQGMSGFVRFGVATDALNMVDWTGSTGLRYQGLIKGRDDDVAGIAVTVNHLGDSSKKQMIADGLRPEHQETDFEMTYRTVVTPYFAIQPSVHYIRHPSMDHDMKNAWVIATNFDVEF